MKKSILFLVLVIGSLFISQAQNTFTWESLPIPPPPYDMGLFTAPSASETIAGVTATVTNGTNNINYDNGYGFGGTSGIYVFYLGPNNGFEVSFNSPINISSVYTVNLNGTQLGNVTITPTGGTNTPFTYTETTNGNNSLVNWQAVTSFTIFNSNPSSAMGVDNIEWDFPVSPTNNILYVNKTATGNNSGDSWANAIPELADALKYSKENEGNWATTPLKIWVAGGTYKPLYSPADDNFGNDVGRDNAFLMVNNVQVYGGFAGSEATLSERDLSIATNKTILSGDIGIANDISDNTYHVVVSSGAVAMAELDGFTITNGYAGGFESITINGNNVENRDGGGMYCISSSPVITNVVLSGNTAVYGEGGGIFNIGTSPSLTNITLSGNTAQIGGGMSNNSSNPKLINVIISGNTATSGGGIANTASTPVLINVIISGNILSGINPVGSAIFNFPANQSSLSSPIIKNSIVWGDISGGSYTASHSLIEGSTDTSNGNIDATGLTAADIFNDPTNGDYSLKNTSPAINAGSNSLYEAADGDTGNNSLQNDVDLAGNPRVYDGTPTTDVIDMGAYEFQGEPVLSTDFFITTWETTTAGESITIPTFPGETYSYTVDWGDGDSDTNVTGDATHSYTAADTYTVKITGTFPRIFFNFTGDRNKIKTVQQWGNNAWTSMAGAFYGCSNLTVTATDVPDLSNVTDMTNMFRFATSLNGGLSNWNVSNVTNMEALFAQSNFNGDISNWNVENVQYMRGLFYLNPSFNQDISNWDVDDVTNMYDVFHGATSFDQNIGNWNVQNVTTMYSMFKGATSFDQDLSAWDISSIDPPSAGIGSMLKMFEGAGLSNANYDSTLIGWATLGSNETQIPVNITFDGGNSQYCASTSKRQELIDTYGWTITDAGKAAGCSVDYIYDNGWTPGDPSGIATANDNILVVNGNTTLTADTDVNNITVDAGATLNIAHVLYLNGDITNNGNFVFKSTEDGDGELAAVPTTSTISGNITVERYMSANRSYRSMSSAVTTTSSIHANWQESATSATDNPNSGFGTHITGTYTTDQENGFDITASGNKSLFTLNVNSQEFDAVGNTDVNTLTAGDDYLIFIRGSRAFNLTADPAPAADETILRATGTLQTGSFTKNLGDVDGGNFVAVANPYQSAIDLNSLLLNSTNINANYAYVYDPTMGSVGGYATVNLSNGIAIGSTANQFIQPGQAVQVASTGGSVDIVFGEADKDPGMHTATFSNENPFVDNAHINGHFYTAVKYAAGETMHDSFSILFNQSFDNALNNWDAVKAFNFTENMGIGTPDHAYSVERRQLPVQSENIVLFNTNYNNQEYALVLEVSEFAGTTPYLIDNYTGEQTELQAGENVINFSVDQNVAESIVSNRFYIHFGPSTLSVDSHQTDYGIQLYPNPTQSGAAFYVTAGQFEGQNVSVSITDLLGKTVYSDTKQFNAGKIAIQTNTPLDSGVYFVRIGQDGKTVNKRLIIK